MVKIDKKNPQQEKPKSKTKEVCAVVRHYFGGKNREVGETTVSFFDPITGISGWATSKDVGVAEILAQQAFIAQFDNCVLEKNVVVNI